MGGPQVPHRFQSNRCFNFPNLVCDNESLDGASDEKEESNEHEQTFYLGPTGSETWGKKKN